MAETFDSCPISSNSRTKLNALRYNEGTDDKRPENSPSKAAVKAGHDNKENQNSWVNGVVEPAESQLGKGKPSSQTKETKENKSKECPQTPANRIPLADLISNTEDAFNLAPGQELTPDDHVIWQHVPVSSNPGTMSQATGKRGKKRRRSSSPSSSPLSGGSKGARKEAFNLQTFQSLLKTPQSDLASDLWNNYVGKSAVNDNGDLPPPRFANLLSSSPHTPASARASRDSSGLRRSISCNADWPASKAKKRRTGKEDTPSRAIFSRTKSNVLDSGKSKSSKINFLLEKIEKSLHNPPPARIAGPSSLSPLPARADETRSRSISPVEERKHSRTTEKPCQTSIPEEAGDATEMVPEINLQGFSSEFEDDDLDTDFLELAEASMDPFQEPTQFPSQALSAKLEGGQDVLASKETRLSSGVTSRTASVAPTSNLHKPHEIDDNDADEFEDDYEGFSDNLEDMMAEYDEKPVSSKPERPAFHDPFGPDKLQSTAATGMTVAGKEPLQGTGTKDCQDASSGDEFEDDFDLEAIEQSMMQPTGDGSNENLRSRQAIKRYLIVDTTENTYVTQKGRTQPEQILLVQDDRTQLQKVIILRESWFDSPCSKDSYIHLIGEFDATGQCIVNDSNNMIILHPDHLISATVVADSISCQRRAVLQDRVKAISELGKAQAFGNIFHEVFQEAIKANQWDLGSLRVLVESIILKHVEDMYVIHMTIPEGVDYVMSRIPEVKAWADIFLRAKPTAESVVEDRNNSKLQLSINKLLEVEEHIWSPMYGLKGNIDATVQIACHDEGSDKTLVVPLELKTGKRDTNQAHRAQTALYTLLLSDRYDVEVTFGLLYYLEISKTLRICGIRHELLQMIQERNRLAGYVRQRLQLPPMVQKPRMCNNCYAKTPCFIYHKLADDGDGETSGLGDDFTNAVDHLTPKHRDFFRKWDELLTKEESSMMRFRRELWTLISSERESLGRCFGNVVIEPGSACEDKDGLKINRYRYTFIKKEAPPSFSFGESQITTGEPVVISDEKGHFALANGYVTQVTRKRITVAVDRRLHNARTRTPGFDAKSNQTFRGIMEVEAGPSSSTASPMEPEEQTVFRLDKDEFSNGMATVRNNLISMMQKDLFQASRLRRLIIEGEAPVFKPTTPAYTMSSAVKASLNVDQKRAIDKVMSAQDYALVLGMPGTGKTTTIAHIIRALTAQGKSVLLTSYTHTAVDNILLKIRDDKLRILRIGATAKVHPEVQQFVDLAAVPKKSIEELKELYEESQVVATTCLGINHVLFNQRTFDYCIVDEASQITLPVCLGPIRMARTFILVGDHYQLPPLVQNKEAQEGGLDVSLFKLLSDSQPESVVNLEHQYRMCDEIMLLSNTLIYSGRLKCGTAEVASRCLEMPNVSGLKRHHPDQLPQSPAQRQLCLGTSQGRCWLRDLVDPWAKTRLVNTDTLITPAHDTANGSRMVNPTEAVLCTQLVEAFISCGIPAREIGVITLYRSQLALLKQHLRHRIPELEMHTADKFQGRDKEIIILSCVRSNSEKNVGDLLRDWRRVNVALTRARTKLLVVGSKSTLRDGNELLRKYVQLVENRGWVYDLPRHAVTDHVFEEAMSLSLSSQQQQQQQQLPPSQHKTPNKKSQKINLPRNPLSPVQGRLTKQPLRKPEKTAGKLLSGDSRVIGKRPVLQDMVNDLVG